MRNNSIWCAAVLVSAAIALRSLGQLEQEVGGISSTATEPELQPQKGVAESLVSTTNDTAVPQCIFTSVFRGQMYNSMWQFMNPRMITILLSNYPGLRLTHTAGVEDFDGIGGTGWPDTFKRSICFKGDASAGGHYVYVDGNGVAQGSYENGLLIREDDDGICHGAAMCYWLYNEYSMQNATLQKYNLAAHPQSLEAFAHNYRVLLQLYIDLIETGQWDQALWQVWHGASPPAVTLMEDMNVHGQAQKGAWTFRETGLSLQYLKEYIPRFQNCRAP